MTTGRTHKNKAHRHIPGKINPFQVFDFPYKTRCNSSVSLLGGCDPAASPSALPHCTLVLGPGFPTKSIQPPSPGAAMQRKTRVMHGGRMKFRHKPNALRAHYELIQHIPGPCGALHSPCGGASQQRGPLTHQHALIGFTHRPTHPGALHTRAHPYPPFSTLTARATHVRPLLHEKLTSLPSGVV